MTKKILFSIQILLIFSCSRNIEIQKPENSNVITYQMFSSFKSIENNLVSESFGIKDFLFYVLSKDIFVQKITIKQIVTKDYDRLKKVSVYTNNGFLGNFDPETIIINQNITFCLIVADSLQNQRICKFYSPNYSVSLFFPKMNKPIAIQNIHFYKNDTTPIQMSCLRGSTIKSLFQKESKKIVCKQNNYNMLFCGSYGIATFCEGSVTDTFCISFQQKSKYRLKRFVFQSSKVKIDTLDLKFEKRKYEIEVSKIGKFFFDVPDSMFVDLSTLDTNFIIDIKYATTNNFTGKQIYTCPKALLRYGAAKDLVLAQNELLAKGFKFKIFDAYRPLSAQYVLWETMPNINYVAPPQKGSIHNRGAAIDVTLTDMTGKELNMGTSYDFFGIEAFSDNLNFSEDILQNRQLLHSTLQKYNFIPIRTEWWHLSHRTAMLYPIENILLPCDEIF